MIYVLIIAVAIVLMWLATEIYDDMQTERDTTRRKVERDYTKMIDQCKRDPISLGWLTSLNDRFKNFINSNEYHTRKPYDFYKLRIHSRHEYCGFDAFIAVDKHRKVKFVVNFIPSSKYQNTTDAYLKYCIGYDEISDFIKKCEKAVMECKLEKEQINRIENIINK